MNPDECDLPPQQFVVSDGCRGEVERVIKDVKEKGRATGGDDQHTPFYVWDYEWKQREDGNWDIFLCYRLCPSVFEGDS